MFDNSHVSLDDATTYPNSSFTGAKVFAFATSDSARTTAAHTYIFSPLGSRDTFSLLFFNTLKTRILTNWWNKNKYDK